jgi:hypothetical protein
MEEKFLELRLQWYQKLKDEGFKDIEDLKGRLERQDRRTIAFQNRESIRRFFMQLSAYLDSKPNISPLEYDILKLYADGIRVIRIALLVKKHKATVHRVIKSYKMGRLFPYK